MIESIQYQFRKVPTSIIIIILLTSSLQSQNYVTTYAGTGSSGFINGDTSIASFNKPFGICIDDVGNLFIADAYNHCIRKISTEGEVSTYAGIGTPGYLDGPAAEAKFNQPFNICFDDEGNMYVSDFINQRIRKISADMVVTTVAGSGIIGHQNGTVTEARFNYPRGICLDDTGNIYIGDSWNHRIRKISVTGMVSDWAGGGTTIGVQSVGDYVDASDTSARFYTPCELSIDQFNNIFVADAYNHRIRKIDASRMVTTIAGSSGFGPNGGGFQNGSGDVAKFDTPTAVHVTLDGTIFVGDGANQVMRRIDPENNVTTHAGTGEAGFLDGVDSLAMFNFPRGSVMDYNLSRLYVVDYNNHAIRIIHIETTVGNQDIKLTTDDIHVFPNPCSKSTVISYQLPNPALVKISIINNLGKIVDVIQENQSIGKQQLIWNATEHSSGVYYFTIEAGYIIASGKLVVIK